MQKVNLPEGYDIIQRNGVEDDVIEELVYIYIAGYDSEGNPIYLPEHII